MDTRKERAVGAGEVVILNRRSPRALGKKGRVGFDGTADGGD